MIRRWIRGVLLPLVLITVMACTAQAEVFTDQEKPEDWEERDLLRIWALSFLDNDAFVLECGGKTMLLDGGESRGCGQIPHISCRRRRHGRRISGRHLQI